TSMTACAGNTKQSSRPCASAIRKQLRPPCVPTWSRFGRTSPRCCDGLAEAACDLPQSQRVLTWRLQLARDTLAKRFHVGAHGYHRAVRIVTPYGAQDRFVLLLEAVVVVRRGEGNVPKPQRALVELANQFGKLVVLRRMPECEMKIAIEHHHHLDIAI